MPSDPIHSKLFSELSDFWFLNKTRDCEPMMQSPGLVSHVAMFLSESKRQEAPLKHTLLWQINFNFYVSPPPHPNPPPKQSAISMQTNTHRQANWTFLWKVFKIPYPPKSLNWVNPLPLTTSLLPNHNHCQRSFRFMWWRNEVKLIIKFVCFGEIHPREQKERRQVENFEGCSHLAAALQTYLHIYGVQFHFEI